MMISKDSFSAIFFLTIIGAVQNVLICLSRKKSTSLTVNFVRTETLLYLGAGLLIALLFFGGSFMANTLYDRIAKAIMEFEGYFEGSVSWKNNNPGNLKFAGQAGATGADSQGHAIFSDFQVGYRALINQIRSMASGQSSLYPAGWSLYQVFARYAEANSREYAEFVASRLGVSPNMTLQQIERNTTV